MFNFKKALVLFLCAVMLIGAAMPVFVGISTASFNEINYSYGVRTKGTAKLLSQVASGTFEISFVNNVPHWPQSDYYINIDYEFKDANNNGVRIEPSGINTMTYSSSMPLSGIQGLTISIVNYIYQINDNDVKTLSINL